MGEGKANIFRFNIANFFDNVFKDCWLQRLILDFLHSAEMETLLNKIQVEIEVENNLNIVEKELHEKRLTKMREELKTLQNDDWMHGKINEYISF